MLPGLLVPSLALLGDFLSATADVLEGCHGGWGRRTGTDTLSLGLKRTFVHASHPEQGLEAKQEVSACDGILGATSPSLFPWVTFRLEGRPPPDSSRTLLLGCGRRSTPFSRIGITHFITSFLHFITTLSHNLVGSE